MKFEQLIAELHKHDLQRSLHLDATTYIENVFNTVKSLETYLRSNSGKKAYKPYYDLLVKIYEKLEDENNR